MNYSSVIILLVALIAMLFLIIGYVWYRVAAWRRKFKQETEQMDAAVHGALKVLRKEVEKQIELLDRKPGFNAHEKIIRNRLYEILSGAEESLKKEIEKMRQEAKL